VFEVERCAPELGHPVEVVNVDEDAVDDERHATIVAGRPAPGNGIPSTGSEFVGAAVGCVGTSATMAR
jgi:hypothetical protein